MEQSPLFTSAGTQGPSACNSWSWKHRFRGGRPRQKLRAYPARFGESRPQPDTAKKVEELEIQLHDTHSDLLGVADIVTLHLPLTVDTQNIVNSQFLNQMRPGAMLINTSRGGLVNEESLLQAMNERDIRVGLDVYSSEPTEGFSEWTSPLSGHPNFVGTHHIGASTHQARDAIADGALETIREYERGIPPNCVNIASRPLEIGRAHV